MADPTNPANGAAEPQQSRSLRDIAEAAYDEVVDAADQEDEADEASSGQEDRPRDSLGRFVKTEPGEAEAETPPSPESEQVPEADQAHPAPVTGEAAQPPSNWSAEVRARFQTLDPEDQKFLLERHHEMESDYQKRIQATAISNQFVQAVAPVFSDPDIAESLRREGRTPIEAVYQWGGFHKRALSPDLTTRVELLFELAQRMQIDPAAVFGLSATPVNPVFTPEQLADPATKRFADFIGQTSTRIQALEAENQRMHQREEAALVGMKRVEIDTFADQKNADGSLAHPLFDQLLPVIMERYQASPGMTMAQAYDAAVKPIFDSMRGQVKTQQDQRQNVQRAQAAVRGNVRGMTAPVSKPAAPEGKRSLRTVLEESADEVGW
jgi:hypothetical protein